MAILKTLAMFKQDCGFEKSQESPKQDCDHSQDCGHVQKVLRKVSSALKSLKKVLSKTVAILETVALKPVAMFEKSQV